MERLKEDSDRRRRLLLQSAKFPRQLPSGFQNVRTKRSVCISDALQYHRWKGTSDGETGEIGSDGRGITKLHPTQSASGRFFYEIQFFSVFDSADRDKIRKIAK